MFDVEWVVLTGGGAHGIEPLEMAAQDAQLLRFRSALHLFLNLGP